MVVGTTLSIGRLFHANGIKQEPESFDNRITGMKLTFSTLIGLVITNLGWVVLKLI